MVINLYTHVIRRRRKNSPIINNPFSQLEGAGGVLLKKIAIKRTIIATDKERDPVRYCPDNVDGDMCEGFCSFTIVTNKSIKRRKKKKKKKQALLKVPKGIFNKKDPDG